MALLIGSFSFSSPVKAQSIEIEYDGSPYTAEFCTGNITNNGFRAVVVSQPWADNNIAAAFALIADLNSRLSGADDYIIARSDEGFGLRTSNLGGTNSFLSNSASAYNPGTFLLRAGECPGTPVTLTLAGPTVTASIASNNLNAGGANTVTVTFSEAVTGFDPATEATVTNGSVTGSSGSGTTYTLAVVPATENQVTVTIPADVAVNGSGAGNSVSNTLSYTPDFPPTVQLGAQLPSVGTGPNTISVEFSEAVSGLSAQDFAITNGTAGQLTGSDGDQSYTLAVTPDQDGAVEVSLPAGTVQDIGGNGNAESNTVSFTSDQTQPSVTISDVPTLSNGAPFTATITFSEAVGSFVVGDIGATNANLSTFQSGTSGIYTVLVTPDGSGDVTISVDAGVAVDALGNANLVAQSRTALLDSTAPTVSIDNLPANSDGQTPFTVIVTFSESVSGFALNDLAVTSGSADDLQETMAGLVYSVRITPDGSGDIALSISAAAAQDAAGNGNSAATQRTVPLETEPPTVVISGLPTVSDGQTPFTVTITFNEAVTGFALADIGVTNARVGSFRETTAGTVFTAQITPDANGDIAVSIVADSAQDAAGNGNLAAGPVTAVLDDSDPVIVSIVSQQGVRTDADVLTWVVTFSEPVTGVTTNTFSLSGTTATITSVEPINQVTAPFAAADAGAQFSALPPANTGPAASAYEVSASGGDLSGTNNQVQLAVTSLAGVTDAAGNEPTTTAVAPGGTDDSVVTVVNDTDAPMLSAITAAPTTITDATGSSFTITLTFSEAMNQTVAPTIVLSAPDGDPTATLTPAAGSFANATQFVQIYSVLDAQQLLDRVDVSVSGAQDAAGNTLLSVTQTGVFGIRMDADVVSTALAETGRQSMERMSGASVRYRRSLVQGQIRGRMAGDSGRLGTTSFVGGDGAGFYVGMDENRLVGDLRLGGTVPALSELDFGQIEGHEIGFPDDPDMAFFSAGSIEVGDDLDSRLVSFGLDHRIGESSLIGLLVTYEDQEFEFTPNATLGLARSERNGFDVSLFGAHRLDQNLSVEGAFGYGWFDNETSVSSHFGQFDSDRLSGFIQGTVFFDIDDFGLYSSFGLEGVYEQTDGYTTTLGAMIPSDQMQQFSAYLDQQIRSPDLIPGEISLQLLLGGTARLTHRAFDSGGSETEMEVDLLNGLTARAPVGGYLVDLSLDGFARDLGDRTSYGGTFGLGMALPAFGGSDGLRMRLESDGSFAGEHGLSVRLQIELPL